jgi:hypothetical protein
VEAYERALIDTTKVVVDGGAPEQKVRQPGKLSVNTKPLALALH